MNMKCWIQPRKDYNHCSLSFPSIQYNKRRFHKTVPLRIICYSNVILAFSFCASCWQYRHREGEALTWMLTKDSLRTMKRSSTQQWDSAQKSSHSTGTEVSQTPTSRVIHWTTLETLLSFYKCRHWFVSCSISGRLSKIISTGYLVCYRCLVNVSWMNKLKNSVFFIFLLLQKNCIDF